MSFTQFVAFRYLSSSRGNRFFSWISSLSILGICISVAAMVVVLSVINGFKAELRDRFLQANAHILAYKYPAGLSDYEQWVDAVMKDFGKDVTGVAPFVHYETMARRGSIMHGVLTRGISPVKRETVQSAKKLIRPHEALTILQQEIDDFQSTKQSPEKPAIIVGAGLLKIFDAKIGDDIEIISPTNDTTHGIKKFRIVGVYDSGLKFYDNRIMVMSLSSAQTFFSMGDRVTGLEIGLKQPDYSPSIAGMMQEKYALQIREWQTFNQPLFKAIQMERGVIFLVVSLTALVASFNILTTMFVAVTQRQRDISLLKALGASNKQVVRIFLTKSIFMGIVGSMLGLALAVLISKLLERYKFIDLPEPYWLSHLPVNYDPAVYLGVAALSIFGCFIAGIFPAYVAARVNPTEGFRGTK